MTLNSVSRYMPSFWDFSFQEMGKLDQPAIIDYILKVTGKNKLVYVGHSQANTQMFAGLSDPASTYYLNSKISKFIALVPVVFATQCHNKALKQFADYPLILETCNLWGIYDVFPPPCSTLSPQGEFMKYRCTIAPDMCKEYPGGADLDPEYDNTAKLPIFFSHTPNGASIRQIPALRSNVLRAKERPSVQDVRFRVLR